MSSNPKESFLRFAETCELVRSTRSKLAKIDFVATYFKSLDEDSDLEIASNFLSGRLFPPGSEFGEINVGYSLIWSSISSFHGMSESELSQYYMKYGDLGSAIEDWLRSPGKNSGDSRLSPLLFDSDLTLGEFFSALNELARASGRGSTDRRKRILERVFSQAKEPVEAKYIVRLLGGEMRIGLVEGLVEESIAKAFSKTLAEIRTANLVSGNIGLVAVLAKHDKLLEAKIMPFRPTNFMLADTAENAEALLKKIEVTPVLAEFKYDGIRAQVHCFDGNVKIFSRNLEDVTRFFPEIEAELKKLPRDSVILDGEIVPFENQKPLPFQALQKRLRKLEHSPEDSPIKYFAFDLLYREKSIIDEPLIKRAAMLHALPLDGTLTFSMQKSVSSSDEVQSLFEESKSLGYEGLVVKNPASKYTPGRRGKSWVKLKKELDTLDVVIVAAEYGHGKRAGVISDYTFAVADGPDLKVVGKAYSGLTDAEILHMTQLMKQLTLQDFGYRRTVKPEVVIEVAFDAIQKSNRHNSGFALRFPRIKRIRDDKSVHDIDTIEKVRKIYEIQSAKL